MKSQHRHAPNGGGFFAPINNPWQARLACPSPIGSHISARLPQAELTKRRSRSESRKSSDHRPGVSLLALWLLSFLNCQLRQSLAPLPNQRAADEGNAQSDKHNREAIKRSNTNTVDQSCRDFLRLQPDLDQSTSAARFIAGESAFLWRARSFRASYLSPGLHRPRKASAFLHCHRPNILSGIGVLADTRAPSSEIVMNINDDLPKLR
jgi:hypothetical protein